jgi:hypothetical protein
VETIEPTGDPMPVLWTRILQAIAAGPMAWRSTDEVISVVADADADEDSILDAVADLDVEGLIEVWEQPEGIVITLSALGAGRLGLRLVESGPKLIARWAKQDDPEPMPPPVRRPPHPPGGFFAVVDPRPGPEIEAEQADRAARYGANGHFGTFRRGAGRGEPPRPTLLLGTGLVAWPGPSSGSAECPACGSKSLPPHGYCLCCDRWGLDAPRQAPLASRANRLDPKAGSGPPRNVAAGPRADRRDDPRIERYRRQKLVDRSRRPRNRPS